MFRCIALLLTVATPLCHGDRFRLEIKDLTANTNAAEGTIDPACVFTAKIHVGTGVPLTMPANYKAYCYLPPVNTLLVGEKFTRSEEAYVNDVLPSAIPVGGQPTLELDVDCFENNCQDSKLIGGDDCKYDGSCFGSSDTDRVTMKFGATFQRDTSVLSSISMVDGNVEKYLLNVEYSWAATVTNVVQKTSVPALSAFALPPTVPPNGGPVPTPVNMNSSPTPAASNAQNPENTPMPSAAPGDSTAVTIVIVLVVLICIAVSVIFVFCVYKFMSDTESTVNNGYGGTNDYGMVSAKYDNDHSNQSFQSTTQYSGIDGTVASLPSNPYGQLTLAPEDNPNYATMPNQSGGYGSIDGGSAMGSAFDLPAPPGAEDAGSSTYTFQLDDVMMNKDDTPEEKEVVGSEAEEND